MKIFDINLRQRFYNKEIIQQMFFVTLSPTSLMFSPDTNIFYYLCEIILLVIDLDDC